MKKKKVGDGMVESFENRDLQCANEVAEMARLGKFETEFLIYGTAVQENNGDIYYYATTNQRKLYHLIKDARRDERYFMPIVHQMERLKVPADRKEEQLAKNKYALIKKMKQAYETYLPAMRAFFRTPANDAAYSLLKAFQDEVDGYFDDTKLQLFLGLVEMGLEGKVLSQEKYLLLKTWYDKVRHQMKDDPVYSDNITRIFYGFVYLDQNGSRHCVFDAQEMDVVEKHYDKIMQGYTTSPIFTKQYAFKQFNEMAVVRRDYSNWLMEAVTDAYMERVQHLKTLPGVIDAKRLAELATANEGNAYSYQATRYYLALWNKCL